MAARAHARDLCARLLRHTPTPGCDRSVGAAPAEHEHVSRRPSGSSTSSLRDVSCDFPPPFCARGGRVIRSWLSGGRREMFSGAGPPFSRPPTRCSNPGPCPARPRVARACARRGGTEGTHPLEVRCRRELQPGFCARVRDVGKEPRPPSRWRDTRRRGDTTGRAVISTQSGTLSIARVEAVRRRHRPRRPATGDSELRPNSNHQKGSPCSGFVGHPGRRPRRAGCRRSRAEGSSMIAKAHRLGLQHDAGPGGRRHAPGRRRTPAPTAAGRRPPILVLGPGTCGRPKCL